MRTLVVRCRDWPVVALGLAGVGDQLGRDRPVVVVHANRVVAVSPAARAEGVTCGQRRREAQGRCPEVVVVDHDGDRDARTFQTVAAAVEAFTPLLELSQPGVCALSTRGPSRYFGGDQALADQVHDRVEAVLGDRGWSGVTGVGVADGPFAAHLAADLAADAPSSTLVVAPGATAGFLAPLPVGSLAEGLLRSGIASDLATIEDLLDVFRRLGLRRLGDLAALPARDVLARFGTAGRFAHRLACGVDERPPDARPVPAHLQVEAVLDPPAERVDTAAFVAKALADELHARLDALGLACTRVAVRAETEHGETHERLWRHEGSLSAGAIADRVRWQLDGWLNASAAVRPTSGIVLLVLAPDEVAAASGRQLDFWGGEAREHERAARAFARVQGMLGPDAVTVPEWQGGRGPGERIRRVPVHAVDLDDRQLDPATGSGHRIPAPWPGQVPPPAPATVLAERQPCEVVDATGATITVSGRGVPSAPPARLSIQAGPWVAVESWAGPWPADERWWDPAARRRRARYQVLSADGQAHLLAVEGGRWWVEARYD